MLASFSAQTVTPRVAFPLGWESAGRDGGIALADAYFGALLTSSALISPRGDLAPASFMTA